MRGAGGFPSGRLPLAPDKSPLLLLKAQEFWKMRCLPLRCGLSSQFPLKLQNALSCAPQLQKNHFFIY